MSVPLDRLYYFLANCVNHDLVIYRWQPAGSRNLDDLYPLTNYDHHRWHTVPQMLCHDQEPLMFDIYTPQLIANQVHKIFEKFGLDASESLANRCANLHLRGVMCVFNQYDQTLLLHSEQHSAQVDRFAAAGFVPVYYWSHALIALDWFRYAQHDSELNFKSAEVGNDFLIYNRAWSGTREYRLCFLENLVNYQLEQHCNIRFNSFDGQHYSTYQFNNAKFQITRYDLHTHFTENTTSAMASADYCAEDYVDAGIEVVLETLFDDARWHLTEKTLRPIACGKPFVVMATAGSLAYLRQYGFETFSGLIDESYDQINDPLERLHAVIAEMARISSLPVSLKTELFEKLHTIASRNRQHFFTKLFGIVQQEYIKNMQQAMTTMNLHCTARHSCEFQQQDQSDYHALKSFYTQSVKVSSLSYTKS